MKKLFNLDEVTEREFNFSIFIILLCVVFRNYFRGYSFSIHLNADLFFEITLLLLPISLLLFNKMNNEEVASIYERYNFFIHFGISLLQTITGWSLLYVTEMIPYIGFILNFIGLFMLIAGILNILITILILVTKNRFNKEQSGSSEEK